MKTYIIYDENQGGYVGWSSNNQQDLIIEFALHYYSEFYYPEKMKIVKELTDYLDKNKDTIHSKTMSNKEFDEQLFSLAFGKSPINFHDALWFLSKHGFTIDEVDNERSQYIEEVLGKTNNTVVSKKDIENIERRISNVW